MLAVLYIAMAAAAIAILWRVSVRVYLKYRGTRIVTCPETGEPEAVTVNARDAAVTALLGERQLRLRQCSRWPERAGCDEDCLAQIELAPDECLARHMIEEWYEGSSCTICDKPIGPVNWHGNRPALMDADGRTLEWSAVAPQKIPVVLATHFPVCWDCQVVQSFCRDFPDRMVDRSGLQRDEIGQLHVETSALDSMSKPVATHEAERPKST